MNYQHGIYVYGSFYSLGLRSWFDKACHCQIPNQTLYWRCKVCIVLSVRLKGSVWWLCFIIVSLHHTKCGCKFVSQQLKTGLKHSSLIVSIIHLEIIYFFCLGNFLAISSHCSHNVLVNWYCFSQFPKRSYVSPCFRSLLDNTSIDTV